MGQTYNLGIDIEFRDGYKNDLRDFKTDLKSISKSLKDINKVSNNFYNDFSSSTKKASASLNKLEKRLTDVKSNMKSLDSNSSGVNSALNKQGKNVDDLTKDYKQLEKQLEVTQKEVKDLEKTNSKLEGKVKQYSKATDNSSNSINKHTDATKDAKKATKSFNSEYSNSIQTAIRSTAIWGLATTAIYGTKRALEEVAQVITEVDSQMVGVQKVMGDRVKDFRTMEKASASLGKEYANTMPKVLEQMEEWGRQGKEQNEVIQLTEASLLSANATNIKSADSVKYLVSTMTQFNIEAENSMMIIDQWNEVANNFANTTAMDLAEAMKEAGKPADSLGLKLNQLIGLTTAMAEATAKSGNRLGRSLRTIFANMAETTGDMEGYINGFEEMLATSQDMNGKELNISLRTTQGEYRNLFDVISDLSKEWDNLNQAQKLNVSNLAGNKRRYSDFLSLVENFDTAIDASETALNSFGSALKENETYMESVEAQMAQARVAFESLSNTIGEQGGESALKGLADALESVFVGLEDFINGVQRIKTILVAGIGIPTAIKLFHSLATAMTTTASAGTGLISTLGGMFNPYIAGATVLAGAIFEVSRAIGEAEREAKELENTQETLMKVMQSGANVSYNQAIKASKAIKDLRRELNSINNAQKNDIFGKNRVTMMDDLIEKAQGMEKIFPKIEEYNSRIAKVAYINQEMDKLDENLRKSIVSTNNLGSVINKTGEEFSEAVLKMGQEIDDSLIEKLLDFEDKLYDLRTGELAKNDLVKLKVDAGLLEGFDAEEQRVNNLRSRVSSIGSLYVELQKMKDDAVGGVVEKGSILSALDERIENPNNETDIKMLENIKDRIKKIQDPLDVWHEMSSLIKENFKQTAEELKNVEERLEKGMSRSETRETVEELLGINPQSIQQAKDLSQNIKDAIVRSNEVGLDTTKLKDALADVNEYIDWKEFSEAESEFTDEAKSLMDSYTGSYTSLLEVINNGRAMVAQGITNGFETEWIQKAIKSMEASKTWVKALFARSEGMDERARQANGSGILDGEGDFYKNLVSARKSTIDSTEGQERLDEMIDKRKTILELIEEGREKGYAVQYSQEYLANLDEEIDKQKELLTVKENISAMIKADNKAMEKYQEYVNSNLTEEEEIKKNISDIQSEIANNDNLTANGIKPLQKLIALLKGDLAELKQEARTDNFVDYINTSLEKTKELVDELSNSSVFGIGDKKDAISKLQERLSTIQTQRRGLFSSKQWYNKEEFEEKMTALGMSEKDIKKAIDKLEGGIQDTKHAWAEAISKGVTEAFNSDLVDDFGDGIAVALKSTLSTVFNDKDLSADFSDLLTGGKDGGFGLGLSDGMAQNITAGLKTYASGGSIGQSVLSGVGFAMGGPIGSTVGSMIGGLFGGEEGVEEKNEAESINSKIDSVSESLHEFGINFNATKASISDDANFFEGLFGKKEWVADNLEKAKADLKEMKELAKVASSTFSDMGSSLTDAFANAMSYSELRTQFDQSVGQALEDALINGIVTSGIIGDKLKELSGDITMAVRDGVITDGEMRLIEGTYGNITDQLSDAYETIDKLREDSSFLESGVNASVDNSYSAGSTSNITYHQQFVVEAGAMLGDEQSAIEFARVIEPYITEVIERNQGN